MRVYLCALFAFVWTLLLGGCRPTANSPAANSPATVSSSPVTTASPEAASAASGGAAPSPEADFPSDPRFAAARDAFSRGEYRASLRLVEKARKSGAAPAQALAAEAEIFRVTAYLDHEMRSLRRWTQAAPSDWKPWLKLFYIYLDLNWKREADASSQRVLALAPENARAHVARAVFCYSTAVDARDAAPGIAHARHALALEPDNVAYKNLLATVLVRANRWKEAEGVLRALIAEAPGRTENVMLLYRAVMLQGRKSEAEAVLAGIVRDHPENIEALYEQGVNAFQRKEFEVARTIFERVMAHDVRYARTAFYLGQVYLRQGRAAEGRQLVDGFKALDRNASAYQTAQFRLAARPNDPALHETLGKLYFNAEDYAKAVVEFRRVLDLRPGDAKARMLLRNALNRTGRSFEAEQLAAAKAPAR